MLEELERRNYAPRFTGSGEEEFLLSGLEQQVLTVYLGPTFGSQQHEAVNRSVAVPSLGPVRCHPQKDLLALTVIPGVRWPAIL
jgi:hypothetical protein